MKKTQLIAATLLVLAGLTTPLFAEPETTAPAPAKKADDVARPGKAPWILKSTKGSHESDAILDLFKIGGTGLAIMIGVLVLGLIFGAKRLSSGTPKLTGNQQRRLDALRADTLRKPAQRSELIATQQR